MQIASFNSEAEAVASAGEALNNLLVTHKSEPVLLLLSGGSAFSLLEYVGEKSLGENLTVSLLDERFSQEPKTNNFLELQRTDFYTLALNAGASFLGTLPRQNETAPMLAERMENNLKNWRLNNPTGKIFATIGMGEDGHIAGIFPHSKETDFNTLFNADNWVISHDLGPQKTKQRITATLTFLKKIDNAIVFICGEKKQQKFLELKSGLLPFHILPANAINLIAETTVQTNL
ncbi:MAG: 6-phosphogluconolactonase [Candidatus Doudnabacteria bacterium]|nr:6-phosphogluconolactonase [Candidatus Doudnabacteria bacterium]